jgi:hypothetical protein
MSGNIAAKVLGVVSSSSPGRIIDSFVEAPETPTIGNGDEELCTSDGEERNDLSKRLAK